MATNYAEWAVEHEERLARVHRLSSTGKLQISRRGVTLRQAESGQDLLRHVFVIEAAMRFGVFGPMSLVDRLPDALGVHYPLLADIATRLNRFIHRADTADLVLRPDDLAAIRNSLVYLRDVYRIETEFQTITNIYMPEYHAGLALIEDWVALVKQAGGATDASRSIQRRRT